MQMRGGALQTDTVASVRATAIDDRRRDLLRLANEHWDVLVVGGGVTGCGILLDATSRGLRAALIEQDDFAAGTSSRSSRLIHGGLRYLEQLQVGLVREALRERARLLRIAPHLVHVESFLFPIYGHIWDRMFFSTGMALYDLLGAAADGGRHRYLSATEALRAVPSLRKPSLRGGLLYHDGLEDDARYVMALMRTSRAAGGVAVSRVAAEAAINEHGRMVGCVARDHITGDPVEVRAGAVIDATGAWASRWAFPDARREATTVVPSRGTHIVVPRDRVPSEYGLTLRIPGRVCFLVPGPRHWIIGTTDKVGEAPAGRPTPTACEVSEILDNVNRTLDLDLAPRDVVSAYTGIRPLAAAGGRPTNGTVKASREHRIRIEPNGFVRVSGGKFTTYRLMAEQTVDAVLQRDGRRGPASITATQPLLGAGSPERLDAVAREIRASTGLPAAHVAHLVRRYGVEAPSVVQLGRDLDLLRPLGDGSAYLEAEIAWSVREESALSLDDVLSRRTRIALEEPDRGAAIAMRAAELLGDQLGWERESLDRRVAAYLASAHAEYDVPAIGP